LNTHEVFVSDINNAPYRRRHNHSVALLYLALSCLVLIVGSYLLSLPQRAATVPVVTSSEPASWSVEGALTEACTCAVPCTCNFGEGPSPHDYCYALYSYEIRKGHYNDISLDGLHFGATDLKNGRTIFVDERASEPQREALRVIAARVILRAKEENALAKAKEIMNDVRYVQIKQDYNERRNHLNVNGIGEFSADYIMGLDKKEPVVVRNNTTWRIHDAIKAKTSDFHVKVGKDSVKTKNTNSNQGDFEYTDKTDFGSPTDWSCGACEKPKSPGGKGEASCRM
jgi:hypothetical protein